MGRINTISAAKKKKKNWVLELEKQLT